MEDDNDTASKLMNDEIKEILESLQYNDHIGTNDKRKLRDYITNLQHTEDLYNQLLKDYDELEQAYQELKDSKQWWNNRFNAVQRDYEDYKSRIEKAVEILKRYTDNESNYYVPVFKLIDILNGRSDE